SPPDAIGEREEDRIARPVARSAHASGALRREEDVDRPAPRGRDPVDDDVAAGVRIQGGLGRPVAGPPYVSSPAVGQDAALPPPPGWVGRRGCPPRWSRYRGVIGRASGPQVSRSQVSRAGAGTTTSPLAADRSTSSRIRSESRTPSGVTARGASSRRAAATFS